MMAMLTMEIADGGWIDRVQAAGQRQQLRDRTRWAPFPASVMPPRSRNWLAKMMTAMPAVKPTVTG